jgi:amino acid transporter
MSEAKNPRRDSVFALFVALAVCGLIYTAVQWVVLGVLGPDAVTDRPLAEVARVTMGNRGAALVAIGALVCVYGYLSAKLLAMPRVTFALAEQGDLPGVFAIVSPRFHTPWVSILVYGAVVWGLAIIGSFTWNVTLSVVSRLVYYGLISAAVIALRYKQPNAAALRLPFGPLLAVLGVLITLALIVRTFMTQADLGKSLIVVVTVAAALLNWVWARQAHPEKP